MLVRWNKDVFFLSKVANLTCVFLFGTASFAILGQVRNNVMQLNLRALRAFHSTQVVLQIPIFNMCDGGMGWPAYWLD